MLQARDVNKNHMSWVLKKIPIGSSSRFHLRLNLSYLPSQCFANLGSAKMQKKSRKIAVDLCLLSFYPQPTDLWESLFSGLAKSKYREARHLPPIGQGVRGAHLEQKMCYYPPQKTDFWPKFWSLVKYHTGGGEGKNKITPSLKRVFVSSNMSS